MRVYLIYRRDPITDKETLLASRENYREACHWAAKRDTWKSSLCVIREALPGRTVGAYHGDKWDGAYMESATRKERTLV